MTKSKIKTNRGGARAGAGRPAKHDTIKKNITIPILQIEAMKKVGLLPSSANYVDAMAKKLDKLK